MTKQAPSIHERDALLTIGPSVPKAQLRLLRPNPRRISQGTSRVDHAEYSAHIKCSDERLLLEKLRPTAAQLDPNQIAVNVGQRLMPSISAVPNCAALHPDTGTVLYPSQPGNHFLHVIRSP